MTTNEHSKDIRNKETKKQRKEIVGPNKEDTRNRLNKELSSCHVIVIPRCSYHFYNNNYLSLFNLGIHCDIVCTKPEWIGDAMSAYLARNLWPNTLLLRVSTALSKHRIPI